MGLRLVGGTVEGERVIRNEKEKGMIMFCES